MIYDVYIYIYSYTYLHYPFWLISPRFVWDRLKRDAKKAAGAAAVEAAAETEAEGAEVEVGSEVHG